MPARVQDRCVPVYGGAKISQGILEEFESVPKIELALKQGATDEVMPDTGRKTRKYADNFKVHVALGA